MASVQEHQERQRILFAIVQACPVPIALNDDAQNIVYVNPSFIKTFGYSLQDIPTLTEWSNKAYPDPQYRHEILEFWKNHLDSALQAGSSPIPVEAIICCSNGESRTALLNSAPLGPGFNTLQLVILTDITEQTTGAHAFEDAHRLLQSVIDTIPMRVFWKDRESRYLGCNTLFARDGGKQTPLELMGKDDFALSWKEQAGLYRTDDKTVMDSGIPKIAFEEPQSTPNGDRIWLRTSKVPLRNADDEVIGVLGIYDDITELKTKTKALQQAEERYRLIFDASPIALSVFDATTGQFLAVNKAATDQYGYSAEESQHMTLMDLFLPEDLPKLAALHKEVKKNPAAIAHSTWHLRKKDGSLIWVQAAGHALMFEGRPARIVQTQDISDHVLMQQQLRAAQAQYKLIFESSPVPIGVFDLQTFKFLDANQAGLDLYGYTREEMASVSALDIYFPEDQQKFMAYLAKELMQPERISSAVFRNRRKDGSTLWAEIQAHVIDYNGRPARIVQAYDVTSKLKAEEELRKAEAHYRLLFDVNPVAMSIYDPVTLKFLAINDAALKQYGYTREECLGLSVMQIHDPQELPRLQKYVQEVMAKTDQPPSSVWRHRRKDGTLFWAQVSAHGIEYKGERARLALSQDISEIKRSEQREHTRSEVMEQIAKGAPLTQILETIVLSVEQENPSMLCSILLLDDAGEHLMTGAAPSLPDFYNQIVHGLKIGDGVGSCGTAAYTGQRVIVEDIQTHPYWAGYREIAAKARLGACWSNPIISPAGKVIGTFAIYHRAPHSPTPADIEIIEHATHLAGVAIERGIAGEALQLASLIYQNSNEAMVVTDSDNHIIAINPAFTKLTGYALGDVLGKDPSILSSDRQDRHFYAAMWQSINTLGQWQGEIWNRRKDGHEYAEWLSINTIYDNNGKVHRRVALFSDITDRKNAEALIWNQANYDALTQLPNRRLFRDRLEQDVRKTHRDQEMVGLLFIDLDRFKEVNDTLGHHMGDELLIQAAGRIQQCVRDSDSVARLGGDEFTVILPSLSNVSDIGQIAQNILDTLARPFTLGEDQAYVSASVGITVYPDDAESIEDLLKNADQAMYAAKRAGRNRYSYFTPAMQDAANERMRLVRDLHHASLAGEFSVYYQPIVELATGHIHKAEALLRWKHPQHGFISPAVFIPIAEDTGIIHVIGNLVFEESAQCLKRWRDRYDSKFQISINKSPVQFRAENHVHEKWIHRLKEEGLTGDGIVIEITEGLLLHADTSINAKLLAFRDAGIQVAIDDFGTGYSSLSYLKKFDIDYLKIDQSFVRNLGTDESDLALSEAIIVMAHKLGLKVIAEGVETAQQRDILKRIGCNYAQGYLYSKPVPSDQFEAWLDQQQPRKTQ